jgi:hypothetical protein
MTVIYYTDPEYFERLDGVDYTKVSAKREHAVVQGTLVRLFWEEPPFAPDVDG